MKQVQLARLKVAAKPPHHIVPLMKNTPEMGKEKVAFTNVRVDDLEAAIALIEGVQARANPQAGRTALQQESTPPLSQEEER